MYHRASHQPTSKIHNFCIWLWLQMMPTMMAHTIQQSTRPCTMWTWTLGTAQPSLTWRWMMTATMVEVCWTGTSSQVCAQTPSLNLQPLQSAAPLFPPNYRHLSLSCPRQATSQPLQCLQRPPVGLAVPRARHATAAVLCREAEAQVLLVRLFLAALPQRSGPKLVASAQRAAETGPAGLRSVLPRGCSVRHNPCDHAVSVQMTHLVCGVIACF